MGRTVGEDLEPGVKHSTDAEILLGWSALFLSNAPLNERGTVSHTR